MRTTSMGRQARRLRMVMVFIASALAAPAGAVLPAPGDVPVTALVSSGLSQPVGVFGAKDDGDRLFVIQRTGAVRVVRGGVLNATPYFTVTSNASACSATVGGALVNTGFTSASGEQGLLGLALHPSFSTNGQVFASYSDANGDSVIVRFTSSNPEGDVLGASDLQTCLVILRVDQDFENHNGGHIMFGPDGYLYFGLGDGGRSNDPCNRALTLDPAQLVSGTANGQDCNADANFAAAGGNPKSLALLGKMLRIDVDDTTAAGANGLCGARADGAANYAVPADNPFAGNDVANGCDETWAYGLRNPWRWSFDRQTDDLLIGDVGQNHWEEVNRLPAGSPFGANFGWKTCEGTHARGSCTTTCSNASSIVPIIEYNNFGNGCSSSSTPTGISVTGGYRYRGPDAALQGIYFYGDAGESELRYSEDTGGNTWVQPSAAVIKTGLAGNVYAFGEDESGVVYMVAGNTLYRIGAAGPPPGIFNDGFEDPAP